MSMKATSVRLDDETLKRVGRMAEAMDRPRVWVTLPPPNGVTLRLFWPAQAIL